MESSWAEGANERPHVRCVVLQDKEDVLVDIIEKRWEMLHTPLHAAGYILDPEYHGEGQEQNEEVMRGFHITLGRLLGGREEDMAKATAEYEMYRSRSGLFSLHGAWVCARSMAAYAWWIQFGSSTPMLQRVAVKILAQVSFLFVCSGFECGWLTSMKFFLLFIAFAWLLHEG